MSGEEVSKEELEETLGTVFTACAKLKVQLSYFELLTVAAFLYFNRKSIDIGVLEVGMGGRWDSTNVCDHMASVITNVSFDHTEYLGNTLREIATEKAGIIKKDRTCGNRMHGRGPFHSRAEIPGELGKM